jgi:hypothetical protein
LDAAVDEGEAIATSARNPVVNRFGERYGLQAGGDDGGAQFAEVVSYCVEAWPVTFLVALDAPGLVRAASAKRVKVGLGGRLAEAARPFTNRIEHGLGPDDVRFARSGSAWHQAGGLHGVSEGREGAANDAH